METNELFNSLLDKITQELTLSPELPDETMESTLRALWLTASGCPCSAKHATTVALPELSESQERVLRGLLSRRINGIPLMHITKRAHFMGLELEFDTDVFIIRPETEILGKAAVECLNNRGDPVMIDVGCGGGNLTCGIAAAIPDLSVYAVDILQSCVDLTNRNVVHCNVGNRVTVLLGDLFNPLEKMQCEGSIDAVVCNPPYISSARLKGDRSYLLDHEPIEAFDGGPFGFAMHQRLLKESLRFLKPGGALLFEFGAGQHKQVQTLVNRVGGYETVDFLFDRDGVARVVMACTGS